MKKLLCLLFSLMLAVMAAGCGGGDKQAAAPQAGKTLRLPASGLMALKLDSNPSTGYGWQFSCSSPAVSKVGSSFTIPRGDEERMGAPGVEILVLAVTKPGTYNIRMDYKRSWEKMSLQSFNFTVIAE